MSPRRGGWFGHVEFEMPLHIQVEVSSGLLAGPGPSSGPGVDGCGGRRHTGD